RSRRPAYREGGGPGAGGRDRDGRPLDAVGVAGAFLAPGASAAGITVRARRRGHGVRRARLPAWRAGRVPDRAPDDARARARRPAPEVRRMTDVPAVLDRALSLGEAGLWSEMVAELVAALEDEPDDPYLLCWLGVAERERGNEGAAYDAF